MDIKYYKISFVSFDGRMKVDITTTESEMKKLGSPLDFLDFHMKTHREFTTAGCEEIKNPFIN